MTTRFGPITGIFKGAVVFFIASLVSYALRFTISVIVARTLGPDGKGIYVLLVTLGAFLVLFFNFGLNAAVTYLTARKAFAVKDLYAFAVFAALFWGGIGILVFLPVYHFVLADSLLANIAPEYVIWVAGLFPASLLVSFLISLLLGRQYLLQYNLVEVGRIFVNLILQVVSALAGWGISGAVAAWLAANLAALGLVAWFTRDSVSLHFDRIRAIIRPAFSYGSKSYLANLLTFFNYRLDAFLVNFFASSAAVGLYSTGVSFAELLYYVPNAISSALFPKVPALEPRAATELTARLCRVVLLVTVPLSLAFAVAGAFLIPWIFGSAFQPAVASFWLLLPGIIGISVSKILAADLSGRGKPQFSLVVSAVTVGLTILLDLFLIPRAGIQGAAIASTIAYLCSALLFLYLFSRETQSPWKLVIIPDMNDLRFVSAQTGQAIHNLRQAWFRLRRGSSQETPP